MEVVRVRWAARVCLKLLCSNQDLYEGKEEDGGQVEG